MAWFGMDCNIYINSKVAEFAKELKMDVDTAVGKLGRLYASASQGQNESGDISHLPAEEIAAIMRWKKKPAVLVDALIICGLLDIKTDGGYAIHDWEEYNGGFLRSRRKDRERKKT